MHYVTMASPVGELLIVADDRAIRYVNFQDGLHPMDIDPSWTKGGKLALRAARQLDEYFARKRKDFDLPLEPEGTEFQRSVWDELLAIPYGVTRSYGEQAARIGNPNAQRAVGAANGKNPIAIIIPCHRVIGTNGRLTGFGGGLSNKQTLLDFERGQLTLAV